MGRGVIYKAFVVGAAAAAVAAAAPAASASTGGVTAPAQGKQPILSSLTTSAKRFYAYGGPLRVSFQIDGPRAPLPVSLRILSGGRVVRTIALGTLATRVPHTYALAPDVTLPEGMLELRIAAPRLRRGPHASSLQQVGFYGHRFPLNGAFTYGDPFGVDRPGHIHQGQDLLAPQGTPIVAPRGGTVTQVAYQAGGAGYYVVLSGAGEQLDYVFMHLATGTTRVRIGQTVRTGQRLGDVGSTGDASGPHLHFEVWQGPWQAGGRAADPLPYLKSWRAQL